MRIGIIRDKETGEQITVFAQGEAWWDEAGVRIIGVNEESERYELLQDSAEDRKRIGRELAEMRERCGLSIRQLAKEAGVDWSNIGKIETGKYNASIDVVSKVCRAMGAELTVRKVKKS